MDLNPEVHARIVAAADSQYESSGRRALPNVDAVRKAARVNMNDASLAMKDWRRQQMTAMSAVVVAAEGVCQRHDKALVKLCQDSQVATDETLRAAQAVWEG
jgi:colicin import membrane protein